MDHHRVEKNYLIFIFQLLRLIKIIENIIIIVSAQLRLRAVHIVFHIIFSFMKVHKVINYHIFHDDSIPMDEAKIG